MAAFQDRYRAGVNLGGWLSQYGEADREHFETFIEAEDIDRIADWGMDHVRLPIDYPVIAAEDGFDERGFEYIDQCLEWCRSRDLNVIFDLHQAPGYSFDDPDGSLLFEDEDLQDRFVDIWREFAERYESAGDDVVFELLNEVVDPPNGRWNHLVNRTIKAIREIDPEREVIVGGPEYNDVEALETIGPIDDDNVVYTFHFYEPKLFTHQYASWMNVAAEYATTVEYPGTFPGLESFLADNPEYAPAYERFVDERIDREWIENALAPAVEFGDAIDAPLYCGEFGVIEQAPLASRINWCRDVVDLLDDLGIGWACWSYREMDFGLIDADRDVVSDELVSIFRRS